MSARVLNLPEDLADDCLGQLPGMMPGPLRKQLMRSARQFCIDSEAWEEDLTALDVVAGTAAYALVSPYAAAITRVCKVMLGGREIWGDLWRFTTERTLTFTTAPQLAAAGGLVVTVAFRPEIECMEYPETFIDQFGEPIAAHAIMVLKLTPKKDWTDLQGAELWRQQWASGLAKARYGKLTQKKTRGVERQQSPWIV